MIKYRIFRKDLNKWIDLLLVKHQSEEVYSFIDLSKGTIGKKIDSILDAEKLLVNEFLSGNIISIFREFPPEEEMKIEG